jgi:hypothetical protein
MNFRKALPLSLLALACLVSGARAQALTARHSHATALLPDGNVLITGGVDNAGARLTSVQMYNMAANTFDNWPGGGPLDLARSSHTATVLSDGRVLIAGGYTGGGAGTPTNSLEICDPRTFGATPRTCSSIAATLTSPRAGHTATLLSKGDQAGKVLICGGQTQLLVNAQTAVSDSCDLFNPGDNTVAAAAPMISRRMGHAAVLLKSGNVFVTGGLRLNEAATAWVYEPMVEIYDVGTSSWSAREGLVQGRVDHSATVLNNGRVFVAGGHNTTNVLRCVNKEGEECWTPEDDQAWMYTGVGPNGEEIGPYLQGWGTHGYLDGVELFDEAGGRMVLGEGTFGTAPYRFSKHSSVLQPDGVWHSQGGYGNIVRTIFDASPELEEDAVITTVFTPGNYLTANINPATSDMKFKLKFPLSRFVSGRIVKGNAYFARLENAATDPALAFDNVEIFMQHSTASVDGLPVGTLISPDNNPGDFESIVSLRNPEGIVAFDSVNGNSNASKDPAGLAITAFALTFNPVFPTDSLTPNSPQAITGGSIQATVSFTLPQYYRGIHGSANFATGSVIDPVNNYAINIDGAGSATFNTVNPTGPCPDPNTGTCQFYAAVTIPNVTGTLTNLQKTTTIQDNTNLSLAGLLNISYTLNYTADTITPLDLKPSYSYAKSNLVISSMIFSSALAFTPSANSWKDLSDTDISPTLALPVFDQTALITPAADTFVIGGRNCETATPLADCPAFNFPASAAYNAFIPVHKGETGNSDWATGSKLNSPRAFHTSTLLLNGQILTCGGSDGIKPLATCELLDPETRKWEPAASMTSARTRHTATLLPNGNVLVAGGATPSSAAVNTAEIYYPASRSWVKTTPMFDTRQNHTATLLPDGNVLVAGGATQSTYAVTTEIYITSTSYWERGGDLFVPRAQHTATLLRNGNVLLAGGINGFGAVNQSEVYDFQTRARVPGSQLNMMVGRYGHTANLMRDGRVVLIGGSNNAQAQFTGEVYNGAAWADTINGVPLILTYKRINHRSVLLPNGKLMITGGETAGGAQSRAEGFDPDFSYFSDQGGTGSRANHTSVLTNDNYVLNIGGWDGAKYLDTTDFAYFSYSPDMDGLAADKVRNPIISTGTVLFDRGDWLTLQSGTTNFHGITEASGGGAGPMSSSHSNPRVYMQQIDNQSGYMIDMSTYIYASYGGLFSTSTWETSLSSLTVITPRAPWDLPHGWYHARVASNGQFSNGFTVQVTTPRPTGLASAPALVAGSIGTSSLTWTWTQGTISAAEGYALYSSSSNVFITTVAFTSPASFTQTGLSPNTAASVMVAAYNLGGYGPLSKSSTYYTLAATPSTLTITAASFERVSLHWYPNGNTSGATPYEISMSPDNFIDPLSISTPVPFSVNHVSTSATISQLSSDQVYFFRVRARNGDGVPTGFNTDIDPAVSTITVSAITNLTGSPFSGSAINWAWDDVEEPGIYYEIYDVTNGTETYVSSATTTYPYYTQSGLLPNTYHVVTVNAAKDVPGVGPVRGPKAVSRTVYTKTVPLLPGTPNIFTNVSTGSFTASWITNGNPDGTTYALYLSTHSDFVEYSSFTTTETPLAGGLSYDFTGLSPNVRYYVRINAINGAGDTGSTLNLGSKYTLANPPSRVVPVQVTMSGVLLGWDTAGNSSTTIYEVRGTTENFTLSVTTYVPFAALYATNYVQLNGLLTATTYYFDVAARNGDGKITSRIQAYYDGVDDPGIYTLAGPSGSPSGSVGGSSAGNLPTTIAGTLPDGRRVSLAIPGGAFAGDIAIAISSSATNPCSYLVGGRPIEVAIYSQDGAQPQSPVSLTLYYNSAESNAAIDANRNRMVLARYNPLSGQCLPLETVIDPGPRTITATLNHFSVFQLIVRTAPSALSDVLVYPNPFYTNRGNGFVTIANIPAGSKVRIYTLSGEKVWDGSAASTGLIIWKGVNKSGELIASGIYLAVIDSSAGKKVVKIAVER